MVHNVYIPGCVVNSVNSEGCLRAEQSAENDLHEILDSHDIQQFLPINTRIIVTNPSFVKTIQRLNGTNERKKLLRERLA